MRQSKTLWASDVCVSKIARNIVFDRHLSTVGRQTAIENYVSNDLWSKFLDSINDLDLSGVFIDTKTIWNKG